MGHTDGARKALSVYRDYVRSASRRGLAFYLSLDEFHRLAQKPCAYCGKPPSNLSARGYIYNGLDRVKNARGYELKNVVPCCNFCNRLKSNLLTAEELKIVLVALKLREAE
jgi:hypothetical protein